MMPTRYSVDLSFDKNLCNKESIKDPLKRKKARFAVRTKFEERFVFSTYFPWAVKFTFLWFTQVQVGQEPLVFQQASFLSFAGSSVFCVKYIGTVTHKCVYLILKLSGSHTEYLTSRVQR